MLALPTRRLQGDLWANNVKKAAADLGQLDFVRLEISRGSNGLLFLKCFKTFAGPVSQAGKVNDVDDPP